MTGDLLRVHELGLQSQDSQDQRGESSEQKDDSAGGDDGGTGEDAEEEEEEEPKPEVKASWISPSTISTCSLILGSPYHATVLTWLSGRHADAHEQILAAQPASPSLALDPAIRCFNPSGVLDWTILHLKSSCLSLSHSQD